MKCVILAGGRGTRISEESRVRPKPMVEIGGRPILWHIMKIYAQHGINEFVVCLGYRGYVIKEFFANFFLHSSDVTIDLRSNRVEFHDSRSEPWRVTLVETGDATQTGGRLLRVAPYLGEDDFCMTYGDGVADVDITQEIAFHRTTGSLATMAVVPAPARWGTTIVEDDRVMSFEEKPSAQSPFVNGGFFVLSPRVLELIEGDDTPWEREPLEILAARGQLSAWKHTGFWHAMDTMRDKETLESLWVTGEAPWVTWS